MKLYGALIQQVCFSKIQSIQSRFKTTRSISAIMRLHVTPSVDKWSHEGKTHPPSKGFNKQEVAGQQTATCSRGHHDLRPLAGDELPLRRGKWTPEAGCTLNFYFLLGRHLMRYVLFFNPIVFLGNFVCRPLFRKFCFFLFLSDVFYIYFVVFCLYLHLPNLKFWSSLGWK